MGRPRHTDVLAHRNRAFDRGVEASIVNPRGQALLLQACGRLIGMPRVSDRHLQEREGIFDPVVRCEPGVQSAALLETGFAQRRQNLCLHWSAPWSVQE